MVAAGGLSARDVGLMISGKKEPLSSEEEASGDQPKPLATESPHILDVEDGLSSIIVVKISVLGKNGYGMIAIEFTDSSQF